jgi:hypothetical protein
MGPSPRQTAKEEIAEHFENVFTGTVELSDSNRLTLDQELTSYDRNDDETYEGIKVNGEVIVMHCGFCGSRFKYLREVTLVEMDVHIDRIKSELSEDFLDDIGYEAPYTPSWQDNSGCNHNYVHQSFEGNGVKVRCTKCQATKVI